MTHWSDRQFCAAIAMAYTDWDEEQAQIAAERNRELAARWEKDRADSIKTARMLLGCIAASVCIWAGVYWLWHS